MREKGNNFHRKTSCVMPGITKLEHSFSNSHKWSRGSSLIALEKSHFRTMAIKPGSSPWLDEEDGNGSENSPIGVVSCGKDSCSKGHLRGGGARGPLPLGRATVGWPSLPRSLVRRLLGGPPCHVYGYGLVLSLFGSSGGPVDPHERA